MSRQDDVDYKANTQADDKDKTPKVFNAMRATEVSLTLMRSAVSHVVSMGTDPNACGGMEAGIRAASDEGRLLAGRVQDAMLAATAGRDGSAAATRFDCMAQLAAALREVAAYLDGKVAAAT